MRNRWFAVALFALALLLRLGYVTTADRLDPILRRDPLYQDARDYHERALHLVAGHGYTADGRSPDLRRAPGYPVFLAAIYRAFGARREPVRAAHALLGALTCLLVYSIGRRLSPGGRRDSARLAGLLTAVHPHLIYMTAWLYAETVFIFLLFTALWLLTAGARRQTPDASGDGDWALTDVLRLASGVCFLAGVVFGLAALTRSSALGLTLFLLVALPVAAPIYRRRLGGLVAMALGAVLVVLPWTVRNYGCSGRVVPINAEAGWLFWLSNHAAADGGYGTPAESDFPRGDVNLADRDRYLLRGGLRWVQQHPAEWMPLCVRKWQRFWSPATMGHAGEVRLPQVLVVGYALFMACAALGAARTFRACPEARVLHVTAAYFVLIALIFYGCTRFAVPIAPCLCLFAAEGLRAARSTQHAARAGARRLGERLASPFVGLRAACCVLRAGAKRHA